mmetsp:Transcript_15121/g.33840  ORF Transcript_15121/g.33840 Transcript_15121/m.33840 type:complete len:673 (+) Transcript_15121:41-2059(+)
MGDSNVFADLWKGLGDAMASIEESVSTAAASLPGIAPRDGATPSEEAEASSDHGGHVAPPLLKTHDDVFVLEETLRQSAEEMDVRAMSLEELLAEHLDLSSRMNDACVKSVQLYGEVTPSFVLATFTHAEIRFWNACESCVDTYGELNLEAITEVMEEMAERVQQLQNAKAAGTRAGQRQRDVGPRKEKKKTNKDFRNAVDGYRLGGKDHAAFLQRFKKSVAELHSEDWIDFKDSRRSTQRTFLDQHSRNGEIGDVYGEDLKSWTPEELMNAVEFRQTQRLKIKDMKISVKGRPLPPYLQRYFKELGHAQIEKLQASLNKAATGEHIKQEVDEEPEDPLPPTEAQMEELLRTREFTEMREDNRGRAGFNPVQRSGGSRASRSGSRSGHSRGSRSRSRSRSRRNSRAGSVRSGSSASPSQSGAPSRSDGASTFGGSYGGQAKTRNSMISAAAMGWQPATSPVASVRIMKKEEMQRNARGGFLGDDDTLSSAGSNTSSAMASSYGKKDGMLNTHQNQKQFFMDTIDSVGEDIASSAGGKSRKSCGRRDHQADFDSRSASSWVDKIERESAALVARVRKTQGGMALHRANPTFENGRRTGRAMPLGAEGRPNPLAPVTVADPRVGDSMKFGGIDGKTVEAFAISPAGQRTIPHLNTFNNQSLITKAAQQRFKDRS